MLMEYDNTLRLILSEVTNTAVASDDRAWTQASLPVKLGGLGVRSAEVAPSAFLASMNVNAALVEAILPTTVLLNVTFNGRCPLKLVSGS